ncbi:MAG: hypothetical protein AAGN66_01335 [Acidobacteriota bacterium]
MTHPIPNPDRPDLEDLASFVEGRLDGPMRGAVVERLADDGDYYELYVELLRFQDEEGIPETPDADDGAGAEAADVPQAILPDPAAPQTVVPFPPTPEAPKRRRWAPVAGLLAAAGLAGIVFAPAFLGSPPELGALTDGLGARAEALEIGPRQVSRSGGGRALRDAPKSFLLGALLVDLQQAEGEDPETLERDPARDIRALGFEVVPAEPFMDREGIIDPVIVRFGMWTRSAWFAYDAGQFELLGSPAYQNSLRWLRRKLDREDREPLDDLVNALKNTPDQDLSDLFAGIASRYDAQLYALDEALGLLEGEQAAEDSGTEAAGDGPPGP